MGQTLTNGIYLPDEGERNSYSGLEANWRTLDALILTVNGKAAPNIANTWTAAQTFTAGITGDLTGNVTGNVTGDLTGKASRATADEDGINIKSGYLNVAGNQTVSGQKTWTDIQTYNEMVVYSHSSDVVEQFRQKLPKDVSTSTDPLARFNTLVDSAGHNVVVNAEGHWETYVSKSVSLKYKNDSTKAGTVDFRLGSNGKGIFYPQSPFECSLGNSANQWSSVYAQSYYYNGTAWGLDKENVWTTDNKFRGSNLSLQNSLKEIGSSSSAGHYTIHFKDKNSADMGYISHQTTFLRLGLLNKFTNGEYDPNGTQVENYFNLWIKSDGTKYADIWSDFIPAVTGVCNLGTSTNKWKTLNGINPGALSLPDKNKRIAIDTTGWTYTGSYANQILINNATQTISGWLYIRIENTTVSDYVTIRMNSVSIDNPTLIQPGSSATPVISVLFPVVAGIPVYVYVTKAPAQIYLYECLGNV